ncbi:MAG: transketolase [Beggiatoa sp. IS2]|nr:MAG: transketolase [Beggiatoa sp. IS2]
MWQNEVKRVARGIRRRVFEHTLKHQGGYLSQACSAADFLATLYVRILKLGPSVAPLIPLPFAGPPSATNPHSFTGAGYHGTQHPDLDRFFISPAHYALVIYAALVEIGRLAPEGLAQFNQDGSSVEMIGAEHSPGMEVTTGSLAQGLSVAAGVALARKLKGECGRVWVFISDGELQEGQTWEAFTVISHYRLNNLAIIVDVNGQQCDGAMDNVLSLGDSAAKLRAFGAQVVEVNGHDIEAIDQASTVQPEQSALVILAKTNPCQGMDYLENRRPKLHYVRFQSAAEAEALATAIGAQLNVSC